MSKLRVLDLFSGIGGFSLGLERTGGFETVAFCEIEPFPRKVLAKHWPEVPCYEDVRELTAERLAADGIAVDVICGGFPCQDISFAGLGAGLAGERSGLWSEIHRLSGELRPQFVIVENVGALLSRGLDVVLGDLASIGFDAEWHCIPASALGASHRRDRVWIVAYPQSTRAPERPQHSGRIGAHQHRAPRLVADADHRDGEAFVPQVADAAGWPGPLVRSIGPRLDGSAWWTPEPNVGRVADGVPARAHRLKALGNAVVPQIPELIGNAILASLSDERRAA